MATEIMSSPSSTPLRRPISLRVATASASRPLATGEMRMERKERKQTRGEGEWKRSEEKRGTRLASKPARRNRIRLDQSKAKQRQTGSSTHPNTLEILAV